MYLQNMHFNNCYKQIDILFLVIFSARKIQSSSEKFIQIIMQIPILHKTTVSIWIRATDSREKKFQIL